MESLLNFQMDLHLRISKAKTNFKKSPKERLTIEYAEGRLELLDMMWSEFLSGHKDVMRSVNHREVANSMYAKTEIYDQTEETYIDYKCELKALLKMLSNDQSCTSKSSSDQKSQQIKLPKINISNFSGKYSEWSTFRDLFSALVHFNRDLSKVQKLHYLKGYLVGEAEQFLRHVSIEEVNYDRCWKMLEERYNNKKYICHNTLIRLFSQRNIVKESASSLKDLMDTTNDCLAALGNLGIKVESWDVMVIHILALKLDPESRRQWEFNISNSNSSDKLPTYDQFKEFLTNRYRAIEFLDSGSNLGKKGQTRVNVPVNKTKALHVSYVKCPICSEEHNLAICKTFARQTTDARRELVLNNSFCFNCLGNNHSAKYCRTKVRCRVCKRKHHSLLHPKGIPTSGTADANVDAVASEEVVASPAQSVDSSVEQPSVSCFSSGRVYNQALLATALVRVTSKRGTHTVRAVLDQGSQFSFITESTVQHLGLKKTPVKGQISGLGEQASTSKAMVTFDIRSRVDPNFVVQVDAYVLKSITAPLPACKIDRVNWILHDLVLADPEYHTPSRVDMLLGVGVYSKILLEGITKRASGAPLAQATRLGWILSGDVNLNVKPSSINVLHCRTDDKELFKEFRDPETDPEVKSDKLVADEERRCEENFEQTTRRDAEGNIVGLPLTEDRLTMKRRVVYDVSCKGRNKKLLSDNLLAGLTLQPEPLWRVPQIGSSAASAPYLEVKALRPGALDEDDRFAERVLPDLLGEGKTEQRRLQGHKEINEILTKGGLQVRGRTSNSPTSEKEMGTGEGKAKKRGRLKRKSGETIKIVGLTWDRSDDSFFYTVNVPNLQHPVTKDKLFLMAKRARGRMKQ